MPRVTKETLKLRLRPRVASLAAQDPWGIASRIRPEGMDKVLDHLADVLPGDTTDDNINFCLHRAEARGDGSLFLTREAANAKHNAKARGTDKMRPMTGDMRAYLKDASAVERLDIANDVFPEHLKSNNGVKK